MGVRQLLILGGGEPMLRSETVMEILRKIKGIDCELFTNLTLFKIEELKELVELGISRVVISIHGLFDTYDLITGTKGAFEKLKRNLMLLKEFKEKLNSSKPRILVNIVINNLNFKEIQNIIKFVGEAKCEEVALHPMRGYEETKSVIKNLELTPNQISELRESYNELKKLAEKYKINFTAEPLEADIKILNNYENRNFKGKELKGPEKFLLLRCLEPWYSMVINSDGRVGRCTAYIVRNEPLNVLKQGFKEIWLSDFFNQVRSNILSDIWMEGCKRCGLLTTTAELKKHLSYFIQYKRDEIDLNQMVKYIRGW
jgi:radical SAM protein with 4Fe4S-binding SPASM domain